jgi:hypothetical protein
MGVNMFDKIKKKYNLDTKDYSQEVITIQKDIEYLLAHYYRTRLNTKFDIIIVIPTVDGSKKTLITDMYTNSTVDWWTNLDKFLPAIDLVEVIMNDTIKLSTGKRETIIKNALEFQKELNEITTIDLSKYTKDFITNQTVLKEVDTAWSKVKSEKELTK